MFSIIIPTWNNLEMLQLCVAGIKAHSTYSHEIVLHINEGADGTREWADQEGLVYSMSVENIGICRAMNLAFGKTTKEYVLYLNDDMYVLPKWDAVLMEEIARFPDNCFMLSASTIEPEKRDANKQAIVKDYGRDVASFQRERLLEEFEGFEMADWSGSSWTPLVVHRDYWHLVGGFSIEFSPGIYSDPDFSMKMWLAGCRIFKSAGASRVYHFQGRSTDRVKKNNGRLQFMRKWGISSGVFYKHYLKMGEPYRGTLKEPKNSLTLRLEGLKARVYGAVGQGRIKDEG